MKRWLLGVVGLVLLALAGLWVWGLAEAVQPPIMRQITLPLPGMAPGTPPYRVALLSDIHFGNRAMGAERLAAVVAAVNAAHPDVVLLAGDYVNGNDGHLKTDLAPLTRGLAALHAPDGVIAVPGNHDMGTAPARIRAALEAAGVVVLANTAQRAGPLLVLGLNDFHSRHSNVSALEYARRAGGGGAPVVLTHSPEVAPQLPPTMPMMLAGHTHCGQVVFPLIGSLAAHFGTRKLNPHYLCGLVHDPERTVLITGGVGSGSVPIRIGAPTDWWLVTFRKP